jgi:hypothetical protein
MTMPSTPRGSRVTRPGPRWARYAIAVGVVVALAISAGLYLARPASSAPAAAASYGGLPSWLPTPSVPVGRVVVASAAHPRLAIEGDTVSVHLAAGQVMATAVGPQVPEEGQFPVPATTPCTFVITFTQGSGAVPLNPAAFSILDELGHLHYPHVSRPGGGSVPADLPPGRMVTLTVKDVLPTGNGQLRWAPAGGAPIVSWDFDVEID